MKRENVVVGIVFPLIMKNFFKKQVVDVYVFLNSVFYLKKLALISARDGNNEVIKGTMQTYIHTFITESG